MSPGSPVFHSVVTVRIGLKTQLECEHPFHRIRCPCWQAQRSTFCILDLLGVTSNNKTCEEKERKEDVHPGALTATPCHICMRTKFSAG